MKGLTDYLNTEGSMSPNNKYNSKGRLAYYVHDCIKINIFLTYCIN